ncbi:MULTISPECIES: helix-turn-helix domain-containing protein [unclassified Psychrobacter]|uniref:helix-turn-helix domain-containing protein n=1 Tax=unclassified Psychrobacter TaxID=196806 RepID=UPI0007153D20|nr:MULTISPECIES: helix-turn-helix transcriptional regulator [unclassified Psychrobacter]KRG34090.1 hypothetical protein AK822_03970 [Psychrobacter sp. P11F6]
MFDTIGKRLKRGRQYAGIKQVELAHNIAAKQGTVSDLENGCDDSSNKLFRIAICRGVNVE